MRDGGWVREVQKVGPHLGCIFWKDLKKKGHYMRGGDEMWMLTRVLEKSQWEREVYDSDEEMSANTNPGNAFV